MSRALLRRHTRKSCGAREMVVQKAALDPMQSRAQRGKGSCRIMLSTILPEKRRAIEFPVKDKQPSHCPLFFQKNHAAIDKPISTTVARSTRGGTMREKRAEAYPPTAQTTIAKRQ